MDAIKINYPPTQEGSSRLVPLVCSVCQLETEVWVDAEKNNSEIKGRCPVCKKRTLSWNPSGMTVLITCRGQGVSSSKYGQKRARAKTKRNEELAKTQWDNHEPIKSQEGLKPRNPTPGGPLDPNGPFKPKKRAKTFFTPTRKKK